MTQPSLVLPVGLIGLILALGSPCPAADLPGHVAGPAAPTTAPASAAPSGVSGSGADAGDIASVLSGRPDRPQQVGGVELDRPFESLSGGIALRPPVGMKGQREVGKADIVQFKSQDGSWSLVVGRQSFPRPQALTAGLDELGKVRPGLLENTMHAIMTEYQGYDVKAGVSQIQPVEVLRQDLTNLGDYDVGMLVFRYTKNAERLLAQRAILQANDQLFYMIALTTPARKDGKNTPEDPGERLAVETFRAVLDTVRLLDREAIRKDQVERLIRTRTLFYNLTEAKIMATLIERQWRRVLKDGKDIGYQFIVEEPWRDENMKQNGVYIGIRTRIMPGGVDNPFPREDSAANFYTTIDRRHENWSKLTAIDDGKPKNHDNPWKYFTEVGASTLQTDRVLLADPKARPEDMFKKGEVGDPNNPWVGVREEYELNVQYFGSLGDMEPVERPLPPFYLPQPLTVMLPRLLPTNEAKSYLVATYVSDAREVMLRYLEVGQPKEVELGGRKVRAIPITEHVGIDGAVTTHYMGARGAWLGSHNEATRITILPSDDETLTRLWKDANLTRPEQRLDAEPFAKSGGDNAKTGTTERPERGERAERTGGANRNGQTGRTGGGPGQGGQGGSESLQLGSDSILGNRR